MKKIFLMTLIISGGAYAMEKTNRYLDPDMLEKGKFINFLIKAIQETTCDEFDINTCKNKCRGCLLRTNLENRLAQAQEHLILLRAQKRKVKS